MSIYVISDIHGSYNEFLELIIHSKINFEIDKLYVLGDMIDRGPDSGKVLEYLMELTKKSENVKVISGNHEEMMIWYLEGVNNMWMTFGGIEAANSINEVFKGKIDEVKKWVENLPLILEDDKYIYTHAGITSTVAVEKENRNILWYMKDEIYDISKKTLDYLSNSKKIIHGHTPYEYVYDNGNFISIDLGAQVEDYPKLALVNLDEKYYYEYDFERKEINKLNIKMVV